MSFSAVIVFDIAKRRPKVKDQFGFAWERGNRRTGRHNRRGRGTDDPDTRPGQPCLRPPRTRRSAQSGAPAQTQGGLGRAGLPHAAPPGAQAGQESHTAPQTGRGVVRCLKRGRPPAKRLLGPSRAIPGFGRLADFGVSTAALERVRRVSRRGHRRFERSAATSARHRSTHQDGAAAPQLGPGAF